MSKPAKPEALLQRGLKLSHLRLMAALGEAGKLGLAAHRLGITQPAASRLLAEVEQIAQAPMHARTGRGIALSDLGQVLARRAQRVMMEMRDAEREMAELLGIPYDHNTQAGLFPIGYTIGTQFKRADRGRSHLRWNGW